MFRSVARVVRAYPSLLRVGFAEALAYRAEMIVWMLTTTMPLVSLALWSAVADAAPVGRFRQRDFAVYFLATLIVRQLSGSWLVWELNMEIKSGTLAQRLLKPMHPLVMYSAENLSAIPLRAALCAPLAAIAMYAGGGVFPRSPILWVVFFLSVVLAWAINFFTMAIIGSLAFYIDSSSSIFEIWLCVYMILSGYLVPLELFPPSLRTLSDYLPFRYTIAFPVELVTGLLDTPAALRQLGIQFAFAAGLMIIGLRLFSAGTKRFSAFGG